jgi:predicted phosphodiesterase
VIDFDDALQATTPPPDVRRARPEHASGYEWDGNAGFIQTGPLTERPRSWDAFIRDSGLDPDEVEVIEPVQVRGWDSPVGGGDVVRMHYYRLTVRRRTITKDIAALVKAAKRSGNRRVPLRAEQANKAFVVALGDLQLGKMDGDGVEGTFARFLDTTAQAVARYKALRKAGKVGPIYLLHLGDCIEGMVSQGGANTWRTTLTTTEQVDLYEWMLLEQVKALAPLTDHLVMAGVPGNHDEAHRPLHTYGDSWALQAVKSVRRALELAGNYEHVTMHVPSRDELTLTLDVCGTIVGLAHGHQWRAGQHTTWWAKQAHGRQPIGDADLLLSGHLHHLRIEATGSDKTFVQVPALESGSQWWKHRTGEWGQPGIVTAVVGGGSWSSLEVLS